MYDELTKVDIQKMQEEIDYRISLRPQLRADVQQEGREEWQDHDRNRSGCLKSMFRSRYQSLPQ